MDAHEHLEDPDWERLDGPVLIAGDVADLPMIARICQYLPWDAQGIVLLEAVTRIQMKAIDVPEGVSVRWLLREEGLRSRTKGERLGIAVHAWCVEWASIDEPVEWTVWLGPHTPQRVAQMARSVLRVSTPPPSA